MKLMSVSSDIKTSDKNGSLPGEVRIEEFVNFLNISIETKKAVCDWWGLSRSNIRIHIFPFKTESPILGCFAGNKRVAINSKGIDGIPPEMILFALLHETRHSDQYDADEYHREYFGAANRGDLDSFRRTYFDSEKDANSYAISVMRDIGFGYFLDKQERRIRKNEEAADMVYSMMRNDIEKHNVSSLIELVFKQIL
jgi:hypothetical protein